MVFNFHQKGPIAMKNRFTPALMGQKKRSGLCLLLLTLVFLLTFAAPVLAADDKENAPNKPVISFTSADPDTGEVDINGKNLHDGETNPEVFLGIRTKKGTTHDIPLVVDSIDADGKQVIATLPDVNPLTFLPFQNGAYLITVKRTDKSRPSAEFHLVLGLSLVDFTCKCEGLQNGSTKWDESFQTVGCEVSGEAGLQLIGQTSGPFPSGITTALVKGARCAVLGSDGSLIFGPFIDSSKELAVCNASLRAIAKSDGVECPTP
jgi:hypothetical protein